MGTYEMNVKLFFFIMILSNLIYRDTYNLRSKSES